MISDLLFCLVVGFCLFCFVSTVLEQLVDWIRSRGNKDN